MRVSLKEDEEGRPEVQASTVVNYKSVLTTNMAVCQCVMVGQMIVTIFFKVDLLPWIIIWIVYNILFRCISLLNCGLLLIYAKRPVQVVKECFVY